MKEITESMLAMVLSADKAEEHCYLPFMVCPTRKRTVLKTCHHLFTVQKARAYPYVGVRMDHTCGGVF